MSERRRVSGGWRLLAVVVLVFVGLFAAIGWSVWEGLRGRAVAVSAPASTRRLQARRDAPTGDDTPCSAPLQVVTASDLPAGVAAPVPPVPAGATFPDAVEVWVHRTPDDTEPLSLGVVEPGTLVDLSGIPCHAVDHFSAVLDGERVAEAWPTSAGVPVWLVLGPLQRIHMHVEDRTTGEPVDGAWTRVYRGTASIHADRSGDLSWWRPTMRISHRSGAPRARWICDGLQPEVHAEGYVSQRVRVPGCDGAFGGGGTRGLRDEGLEPLEVTVSLESGRTVFVHCSPDGSEECPGDLTCTPSWSVELDRACMAVPPGFATERQNALRCACPPTDAVVRGLGRSYAVPDDAEDIWIDLEDAAGVRGRIADFDGRRQSCRVVAERVAADLEDIGSLGAVGRVAGTCDGEGAFEITGLAEGDWVVEVTRREHERSGETQAIAVPVAGLLADEARDLGELDPAQGAAFEVECEDGLTGESTRSAMVLLVHDSDDFEVGYVQVVACGHRQAPALGGDWEVFVLPWAHLRESLTLSAGDDETVSVTIGDDDAMLALGGALEPGRDSLVVRWVEPGGTLDRLGVQPGDELVDIAAFGVGLPIDDYPEAVLSGVLGVWGTAGIEVVVRSGETGEERWVDFDR